MTEGEGLLLCWLNGSVMLHDLWLSLQGLTGLLYGGGLNGLVLLRWLSPNWGTLSFHLELFYQFFAAAPFYLFGAFLYLLTGSLLGEASTVIIESLIDCSSHSRIFGGCGCALGVQYVVDYAGLDFIHPESGVFGDEFEYLFVEEFVLAVIFLEQTLHADYVLDVSSQVALDVFVHGVQRSIQLPQQAVLGRNRKLVSYYNNENRESGRRLGVDINYGRLSIYERFLWYYLIYIFSRSLTY